MDQIIVAIIGSSTLSAMVGGVVGWLLNRKKFNAEVEHTVVKTASLAADTYRVWVVDLQTRIDGLESARRRHVEHMAELEADIVRLKVERREYSSRTRMMARVMVVILNLLDERTNTDLCNIAGTANISQDDIRWLKEIMDEVVADVDLPAAIAD